MIKKLFYVPLIFLLLVFINSCNKVNSPVDSEIINSGETILSGQLLDKDSGMPLQNAAVVILNGKTAKEAFVDDIGMYKANVKIENNQKLVVVAVKEGYYQDSTIVDGLPNEVVKVPGLSLKRATQAFTATSAASIVLKAQSTETIAVKETGANEIARVTFEVQDSSGTPIDYNHSTYISFTLGSTPGGGEYISTGYVKTDYSGRASVAIVSGTKAGTVQIVAEILGKQVRSIPVNIAILGGMPDHAHFSVAPDLLNIAGLVKFGLPDIITAYVGDKYGNPVKRGTMVYFTTTGGIVAGSATTDELGRAQDTLITAAPLPTDGFVTVTAQTADENLQYITATCRVLFSGSPIDIEITPTEFEIQNTGAQEFFYTLKDLNGNPLSSGQSVTVTVEGDKLKITGETSFNLPDTQDPSETLFSFSVADVDSVFKSRPVSITIKTNGPNGFKQKTVRGTAD
jgi:hypothetical protein